MQEFYQLQREEEFRGYCALGNIQKINELINTVNINSQNKINGWTSLHWAYKRGHQQVVDILLRNGAKELRNNDGKLPSELRNPPSQSKIESSTSLDEFNVRKKSKSNDITSDITSAKSIQDIASDKSTQDAQSTPSKSTLNHRELLVYHGSKIVGSVYFQDLSITELIIKIENELEIKITKLFKIRDDLMVPIHKNQYGQSADLFYFGYQSLMYE